jgi:hypothetical protein
MGAWGTTPWDNDGAADWFAELFETTGLAKRVEETLNEDPEDAAEEIRAAAHVLTALGRVYIWPVEHLDRHLKLAVQKLEAISELEDYEGDEAIAAEIAELRARLQKP